MVVRAEGGTIHKALDLHPDKEKALGSHSCS